MKVVSIKGQFRKWFHQETVLLLVPKFHLQGRSCLWLMETEWIMEKKMVQLQLDSMKEAVISNQALPLKRLQA